MSEIGDREESSQAARHPKVNPEVNALPAAVALACAGALFAFLSSLSSRACGVAGLKNEQHLAKLG